MSLLLFVLLVLLLVYYPLPLPWRQQLLSDGVVPSTISAPISFGLPILDLKLTGWNYREWTLSQNVVVFC